MITLKNINIKYEETLLEATKLKIKFHEITMITGESGCGKTTLLYKLGLISDLDKIEYEFKNIKINTLNTKDREDFRRNNISFVLQDSLVLDDITCKEYLKLIFYQYHIEDIENKIDEILNYVDLKDKKDTYVNSLSGGQRQRLCIAGALIKKPTLLLLDEPTAALDTRHTNEILQLLFKIKQDYPIAIVIVTHENIENYADCLYQIKEKKLVCLKENNTVSNANNDLNNYKKPSFNFYYYLIKIKQSFKRNMQNILSICFAIFLSISIVLTQYNFEKSKLIQNNLNSDYSKKILVENTNIQDNEQIYEMLHSLKGFETIYPYGLCYLDNTIQIEGKTINLDGTVVIQPYLFKQEIQNSIYNGSYIEQGIYISQNLYYQIRQFNNKIEINNNLSFEINGVVDQNCPPLFEHPFKNIIYVPYEMIKDYITDFNQYIIIVDKFDNIPERIIQIESISNQIKIIGDTKEVFLEIKTNKQLQNQMEKIMILLNIFVLLSFVVYHVLNIKQQKKDIILLQTLGLTKVQLVILYIYIAFFSYFISLLFSELVYAIGYSFFKSVLSINGYLEGALKILPAVLLITIPFLIVISILMIVKQDVAKLLRSQ